METKKLHKDKVREIINKISTLVDIYAKVHNLERYVLNISHVVDAVYIPLLSVNRIDFKSFIKQSSDIEVLKFSERLSGLVSDTELEMLFIGKYYSDYMPIVNILQMLLYNIPREVNESDLIELNKLYKKYTKNDKTKTTENTDI